MNVQREIQELTTEAERQGWTCEQRSNGHWHCLAPDGIGHVWIAGTPSDHHWKKNSIARMRRHGFVWPAPKR